MSLKALSDYTFYSRYSQYLPDKQRRETWDEAVKRVFQMHRTKYADKIEEHPELKEEIDFAEMQVRKKRVLGAQRNLQFGGDHIFHHEMRSYNCSYTLCDRLRAFQEINYALLCGTGVGISVQKQHVDKLPDIKKRTRKVKKYIVPDSIEGWSDAFGVLLSSYVSESESTFPEFSGHEVEFDFSLIRSKGSLIANQFKAPGPDGLSLSLVKCQKLIEKRLSLNESRLRPIDCYDFIAHMSDSVLSGGIRRSALLILFSKDDEEMVKAKTGDWFISNPQRARSNNSVVLERGKTTLEEFSEIFKSIKQSGEPGFYFVEDDELDIGANPCVHGDTEILVRYHNNEEDRVVIGYEKIKNLIGNSIELWSGIEWIKTTPKVTGYNKKLIKITLSNGDYLRCTANHKWLLPFDKKTNLIVDTASKHYIKIEADKLSVGDTIWQPHGQTKVVSIEEDEYVDKVYCFTDKKKGIGYFNRIVTGQCVEIGLYPKNNEGKTGFQTCNLSEINGKFCQTKEDFLQCCRAASIVGTLQAGYTNFKYFTPETEEIIKREALLGVSITGLMDNPEILFSEEILSEGARQVKETNFKIANLIGINPAARTTCVKPSGSASAVLGSASGIHPHHARRYIRRVQSNEGEFIVQHFKKVNPMAVEKSVWSATGTDLCVSFLCEVPSGAITKNQINALDFLGKVKGVQKNWVLKGTNRELCVNKKVNHNVSVTVVVRPEEWDEVEKYIYKNRKYFTGISLLSSTGDLDYPQAPFSTVLTPNELVREYGDASVFASGLIVDGLSAFNNNLWAACDTVLGVGGVIEEVLEPEYPKNRNYKDLAKYFEEKEKYESFINMTSWVRRVKQFAERYFNNDIKRATHCLKHVSLWKTWVDLSREYQDIDWKEVKEDRPEYKNADENAAMACSGGKCEISI